MLKIPIDCYDILDVLKLNHYKVVLQLLSYRERHTVCMYIINSILDKETIIRTAEQVKPKRDFARRPSYGIIRFLENEFLWLNNRRFPLPKHAVSQPSLMFPSP
jgi:hypothetical protein